MEKELEHKKNKDRKEHKDSKDNKSLDPKEDKNTKKDTDTANAEGSDKESRVLDLEKTVEEQNQKIAELNDKYLRLLADRDNLIKRTQKEKQALSKYALESFMLDFLPVLDAWDKVESDTKSNKDVEDNGTIDSYKKGFDLIKQQILTVLSKHGLSSFCSKGEKFDPNKHQAMSKVESDDVEVPTVVEEYLKGYMLNDKLLRASFVVVQVPKNK